VVYDGALSRCGGQAGRGFFAVKNTRKAAATGKMVVAFIFQRP
jgi:hypothetical protein